MGAPRSSVSRRTVVRTAVLGAVVVLAIGVPAILWGDAWQAWIESLPEAPFLTALAVLPVVGFPISVLHVATGARFGLATGLLAVAATTAVHLAGAWLFAHRLERPVRWCLRRLGWRRLQPVPVGAAWPFTVWIAVLPGVSYAVKNVVPPLGGVPGPVFFGTAFPLHVARSCVGLALGRMAVEPSWPFAAAVVVYLAALLWLTRWLLRRFRTAAAHGATPSRPKPVSAGAGRRPTADDRTSAS
jgi:hypothetical protein